MKASGRGKWLGLTLLAGIMLAGLLIWWSGRQPAVNSSSASFDGARAFADAAYQVALGPRIPGSAAHSKISAWLRKELSPYGWQVEDQKGELQGHPINNIIARRGNSGSWIVLGAHYDTRLYADRDPDPGKRMEGVPGADDGASGVAVLLELGRTLPRDLPKQIWLVFFDAEDNGNIEGWVWILGSRWIVGQLGRYPDAAVIVDMVGDANLNLYFEKNSDPSLSTQIWNQAALVGYSSSFISSSAGPGRSFRRPSAWPDRSTPCTTRRSTRRWPGRPPWQTLTASAQPPGGRRDSAAIGCARHRISRIDCHRIGQPLV